MQIKAKSATNPGKLPKKKKKKNKIVYTKKNSGLIFV